MCLKCLHPFWLKKKNLVMLIQILVSRYIENAVILTNTTKDQTFADCQLITFKIDTTFYKTSQIY